MAKGFGGGVKEKIVSWENKQKKRRGKGGAKSSGTKKKTPKKPYGKPAKGGGGTWGTGMNSTWEGKLSSKGSWARPKQ